MDLSSSTESRAARTMEAARQHFEAASTSSECEAAQTSHPLVPVEDGNLANALDFSRRSLRRASCVVALLTLILAWGCEDSGFEIAEDADLPATLDEALPAAEAIAHEWSESAFLWGMGGGYTVADEEGRGYNHSFRFYSRRREELLDLHFFAGTHWAKATHRVDGPAPLSAVLDWDRRVTSAEATMIAVQAVSDSTIPSLEVPEATSSRLLSHPVWPERQTNVPTDSLAWRIDFVEKRPQAGTLVWWSIVRVYLHPETGKVFEVVDNRPQVYPNL